MLIEIELAGLATIIQDDDMIDIGVEIPLTIYIDNDVGRTKTIFCKPHWFENKEELKSYIKKAIEALVTQEFNEIEKANRLAIAVDMINNNFVGRFTINDWKLIN